MTQRWYIAPSRIHGVGTHAGQMYLTGEVIDLGIENKLGGMIPIVTYFGSKINHSYRPNVELWYTNGNWYVRAKRRIQKDEEIVMDYNDTPWFIKKPDPAWSK